MPWGYYGRVEFLPSGNAEFFAIAGGKSPHRLSIFADARTRAPPLTVNRNIQ